MATHPILQLMQEHEVILQVLTAVEQRSASLASEEQLDSVFWKRVHRFLVEFADEVHHTKEEGMFFPVLVELGFADEGGPVGVMKHEHVQGRRLTAAIERAIESGDCEALERAAQGYALLLREHIQKENMVLFEMARQRLGADRAHELAAKFEAFDSRSAFDWIAYAASLCRDAGCEFRPPNPAPEEPFDV